MCEKKPMYMHTLDPVLIAMDSASTPPSLYAFFPNPPGD